MTVVRFQPSDRSVENRFGLDTLIAACAWVEGPVRIVVGYGIDVSAPHKTPFHPANVTVEHEIPTAQEC